MGRVGWGALAAFVWCLMGVAAAFHIPGSGLKSVTIFRPPDCRIHVGPGDALKVHYMGRLGESGRVFDSSLSRNQPIEFTLGAGHVIKGWEQGLAGMCPGERRILTVPSDLAYGTYGSPPHIPPSATLSFQVELLTARPGGAGHS